MVCYKIFHYEHFYNTYPLMLDNSDFSEQLTSVQKRFRAVKSHFFAWTVLYLNIASCRGEQEAINS